jgi:hypothetical protein
MAYTAAVVLATLWALLNAWRSFAGAFGQTGLSASLELSLLVSANAVVMGILAFVPVALAWTRWFQDRMKVAEFLPPGFVDAKRRGYKAGMLLVWLGHLAGAFYLARMFASALGSPSSVEGYGIVRWVYLVAYKLGPAAVFYWIGILSVEVTVRRWKKFRVAA